VDSFFGKKPGPKPKLVPTITAASLPAAGGGKRKKAVGSQAEGKKNKAVSVTDFDAQTHLELGVSTVEYATAKKPSPCMYCKGAIANGEPRVGVRQQAWQVSVRAAAG